MEFPKPKYKRVEKDSNFEYVIKISNFNSFKIRKGENNITCKRYLLGGRYIYNINSVISILSDGVEEMTKKWENSNCKNIYAAIQFGSLQKEIPTFTKRILFYKKYKIFQKYLFDFVIR